MVGSISTEHNDMQLTVNDSDTWFDRDVRVRTTLLAPCKSCVFGFGAFLWLKLSKMRGA